MKPYKFTPLAIGAALLCSTAFTSCDDDFDYPPVIVPVATIEPNTTIAEVKAKYWDDARNYADTILLNDAGEHIIISGRVTSNCESGNIYKSLIIEDETAALAMSINESDLADYYKVGQELVIDLTEMYIGKYNGLQQLGMPQPYNDTYEVSFMDLEFFQEHAQVNGLPEVSKLDTTLVTIPEISALSTPEELQTMQSRLIKLENVSWEDGGIAPYCETGTNTNRYIVDADGNRILCRMSSYATFASETLPKGTGTIVAIASYYGTTWQLLLRDTTDCIGFEPADNNGGNGAADIDISEANTTLADLKAKYWKGDTNYATEIGKTDDGDDIVVAVRVASSDKAGNIFKAIYVQDDTDAICFGINSSKLYQSYPVGQTLLINLTGLKIGKYAGLMQIGNEGEYNGTPQVDRMSLAEFQSHTKKIGAANAAGVTATPATIAEIASIGKNDAAGLQKWQARLVKFTGVHFRNGGTESYVKGGSNTNQDLLDADGKSIIVRTSSYADFGSTKLPAGNGNVTGLLSYFNGTWQLLLNDASACEGFDGTVSPDTPDTPDTPTVPTGTATFKKVTTITSGKSYVMVYNGQVSKPIEQSKTYGYLYTEAPASTSGDQLTTSASNAIVFTASGTGYTMQDCYGRYLSMDGEHNNSFQLYTSAANGSTWSATFAANGEVTLTNALVTSYVVGWKTQYSNLAPTNSPDGLPFLYEKVD